MADNFFSDLAPQRAQSGFVPLTGADPLLPGKGTLQQQEIAKNAGDIARTPAEIRKANADADAATAKAERDRREQAMAEEAKALAPLIAGLGLDETLKFVDQAAGYIRGGGATGLTGAVKRTFGYGTDANDLSGTIDTLKSNVMLEKLKELKNSSPTGASGLGALSEREGKMLTAAIGSLDLQQSDEKLLDTLGNIRKHALSLKAVQAGRDPSDPRVQREFGIGAVGAKATPPGGAGPDKSSKFMGGPQDGGGPSQMQLATGNTESREDPALLGIRKRVSEMVRQGASQEDIDAYARSVGATQRFDASAAIEFRKKHPEYQGGYSITVPPQTVPMSAPRAIMNSIGQNPAGAYFMGAGDVISGGTLDNMTDDPALSRAGMAGVAAMNPLSTLAGQVTGGIGMAASAEAGAGRLGVQGLGRLLAGDALPGIAYGAGSADEGSRLAGAGAGGLAGVIGGALGRGIGRVVSGIGESATQAMADRGVRLTPGRLFGGPFKRAEDTLMSYPVIGDLIRPQARRALRDANVATFGEALEPIGAVAGNQVGEEGVEGALDAYSGYLNNTLGPVRLSIDPAYRSGMGQLSQTIPQIPEIGPRLAAEIEGTIAPHVINGQVTGEGFQAIDRGLNQLAAAYKNDPSFGPIIRPALDAVGGQVEGLLSRQAPDVLPAYLQSKEAYKRISTVADAVNAGVNQVDNSETVFTMAQLNRASRNNAKTYGGRNAAASGQRPFRDLARDGQQVLAQTVPDSGTASRLMLPGALGIGGGAVGGGRGFLDSGEGEGFNGAVEGGAVGLTTGLGTAAALASPYALRPLLQRLMTGQRSPGVQAFGDLLGQSRLPGAIALPLLAGGQ